MITENLSTLKIHKLTQAQYDREFAAGRIDANALYLTPEEEIDLSPYVTTEQLEEQLESKLEANDIEGLATTEYIDTEIDAAIAEVKADSSDKDIVVLAEAQKGISVVQVALDTHIDKTDIHVTTEEKEYWDNKSDFSGSYYDLAYAPSIKEEDESKSVVYVDEKDNIIARVDANGFETTVVTADSVIVNNKNVEVKLDEHENAINILDETVKTHTHDDRYYTESEIDNIAFITVDEIDAICGSSI